MKDFKLTALGLAVATVCASAAHAEKLNFAHGWQPSHAIVQNGIEPWMQCVTDATGIGFDYYPSGQITNFRQALHSLESGLTDVSAVFPSYEGSKVALNNMAILPGMGTSSVKLSSAYRTMLTNGSAIQQEWTNSGVVPMFNAVNPPYQLIVAGEPLDTIEKIKGKKIRAGGATINMSVSASGGVPVELPAADMYVAMQRGTVDATVLSMTSAPAYKLEEVTQSVSSNGAFGGGHVVIGMSTAAFEGLSEDDRAAVLDCGRSIEASLTEYLDQRANEVLQEWADLGIDVYAFSDEVVAQLDEMLASVAIEFVSKLEGNGIDNARETYDLYRSVLAE